VEDLGFHSSKSALHQLSTAIFSLHYRISEKLATNFKITAMKLTMKLTIAPLATHAFALRNGTHYTDATFGLTQIAGDFSVEDKDTSAAPKTTETPSWASLVLGHHPRIQDTAP
jgi:hypothetical protein